MHFADLFCFSFRLVINGGTVFGESGIGQMQSSTDSACKRGVGEGSGDRDGLAGWQ